MTTLKTLQDSFLDAVLHKNSIFLPEIGDHPRLTQAEQAAIYTDGYHLRLIEVLQDTYPALHTLVGDSTFERIALDYIRQNPSQHFSVRYYGHRLAAFIENKNSYGNDELLAEMARFEWALRSAFDEKNQKSISIDCLVQLEAKDWGSIQFVTGLHVHHIRLNWNVPVLWKAIEQNADPQPPQRISQAIEWLIWRPELETRFRSLTSQEATLLRLLASRKNFSQLCESLLDHEDAEPEKTAATFLYQWLCDGVIVSYALDELTE